MTEIRAWHNNPDLKAEVVARLHAHRAADEIVQSIYQYNDPAAASGYRGCVIGCTLPFLDDIALDLNAAQWWQRIEEEYGIDREIASAIDHTFEAQESFEAAAAFAVAVIEAIPVGADLGPVVDKWRYAWHRADAGAWLIEHLAAAPVPEAAP